MAATPYSGTATFSNGESYTFSGDDVDGNFVTWDRIGETFLNLPQTVKLVDIALSAAGVDTNVLAVRARAKDPGIAWRMGSLLDSLEFPRLPVEIPIGPNAQFQLLQEA